VMSSATFSVGIIPRHGDHRSGDHHKLVTITPELAITIVRKADHESPGSAITNRSEAVITIRPESPNWRNKTFLKIVLC